MKGLENPVYLTAYIVSNIIGILLLVLTLKQPRISRLIFFLLFVWASWRNWGMVLRQPQVYVDYADLAFLQIYRDFIRGWFSEHITNVVGLIATCQGLIGISMLLKGWLYKLAIICGATFLVAIFPLGVGSAFPTTVIMAAALLLLYEEDEYYLWEKRSGSKHLVSMK
jgi:hypothetical protein